VFHDDATQQRVDARRPHSRPDTDRTRPHTAQRRRQQPHRRHRRRRPPRHLPCPCQYTPRARHRADQSTPHSAHHAPVPRRRSRSIARLLAPTSDVTSTLLSLSLSLSDVWFVRTVSMCDASAVGVPAYINHNNNTHKHQFHCIINSATNNLPPTTPCPAHTPAPRSHSATTVPTHTFIRYDHRTIRSCVAASLAARLQLPPTATLATTLSVCRSDVVWPSMTIANIVVNCNKN